MKNKLLLKKAFGTIIFLLISVISMAQDRQVTGVVQDEKKMPLDGATVSVRKGSGTTITNVEGKFSLKVPAGKVTLIVTYVGYDAATITVGETQTVVAVKLSETGAKKLDDVVIVGVQTQSKRKSTTAISSVLGKDIENSPVPSVDQLLQGRVAGLNVQIGSGEPGVAPSVVVRGNSRVNTNIGDPNVSQARALSGPLYVIDGIPTNPEDISGDGNFTGTNYLAGINVNDIESVDIQKDAAATAAWGSRGANGVIYIKTKRGRSLKPEFRVNMYGGAIVRPRLLSTLTGAEERQQKLDLINQYATPIQLSYLPQSLTDYANPSFNNATDWQGLFYRNGSIKNVDATISAASDIINYRISANYYDEKGIIQQFGFKRYSLRGNFDFKISPKLNTQFIVALSKSDRQRGRKYVNSDDNTPVSGSGQPASFYRLTAFDSSNYTGQASKLRNKNIDDYYLGSLILNYAVLRNLRYTFQGSANITSSSRDFFQPSNLDAVAAIIDPTAQRSYAESNKRTYATYFMSNTLNYNKTIKTKNDHAHSVIVTASQQYNRNVSNGSNLSGYNVPSNDIRVVSGIPQADISGGSSYAADAMLSFVGQAQYDYDGKYLLYGSYRGDASSRFGDNSKWGYFPAIGAGWQVSDEKFMGKLKRVVNYLKIRGSYGISGSQSNDLYAPYNSYNIPGNYGGSPAIQPSYNNGLTKNDLTWTKSEQKNIGLDAQLFNSRINITIDVYDKVSKDDYYNFTLPFYTGFQSVQFNARDLWVSNRGLDLTLNTKNLGRHSQVQWSTNITLSFNKNALAKLPNGNRTFVAGDFYGVDRIFAVGQPIYQMFQLQYAGVYNHESDIPFNPLTGQKIRYFGHTVQAGDPIWIDNNKSGYVWVGEDNGDQFGDRIPSGNPNPKFTGGLVNDFTYKNFSLSILSVFTYKRTIINTFQQSQISNITGGYSSSIYTFANTRIPDLSKLNYWTPEKAKDPNYKADYPALNPFGGGPPYQFIPPISTIFNEDGSYFKIKNISLAYLIPAAITKKLKINKANVYTRVENIVTFKKSSIPNPELVDQLGLYTGGLYPTPTKFTLGVDIQF
jgi:TonB-linked SusC/RagA family outer membrane protein